MAMKLPVALAASPPQKNVGAATRPMASSQTRGYRFPGANPWLAHVAGDPLVLHIGDGGTASHSDQMAVAPVPRSGLAGRRRDSGKAARHVKRLALLQYVEAGPRQFVCQRLDRHHIVRLRLLPFVESFCLGAVAQREVSRLNEGPGQVFITVLGVAFSFFLAVTGAYAVNAPGVGRKVARRRKTANRPRFEQDRGRQDSTNAGYAGQQAIFRSLRDPFLKSLFKAVNLGGKRRNDRHVGLDRQGNVVGQRHLLNVLHG